MFRFYCTKCSKVKRVQNIPRKIENKDLLDPSKRIGICDIHSLVKVNKVIKSNKVVSSEPISVNKMNRKRR